MALFFPDLNTLQLALTSGEVETELAAAPVVVRYEKSGEIHLGFDGKLSRDSAAELKKMGVKQSRKKVVGQRLSCWYQLLPLEKIPLADEQSEKRVFLFELASAAELVEVVLEALRLGNDRQSFRYVSDAAEPDKDPRALLRIIGPPYYSLLRAIDAVDSQNSTNGEQSTGNKISGNADATIAFVEQQPRLWVQLGYQQPFAKHIEPPVGHWLLIRAPNRWEFVEEGPMRDVYQATDVRLPQPEQKLVIRELETPIRVPLKLIHASGNQEATTFWVIYENAIDQIEQLVKSSDDQLISRLAFAVSDQPEPIIAIRLRPSKSPAPVLILDALECRSYLKLPNLFVPRNLRIHPPLRRDVLADLIASDSQIVHWLRPLADEGFATQSIPDSDFRPLTDWADYILDRDQELLKAWTASFRFDFESFVCPDEKSDRSPPKKKDVKRDKRRSATRDQDQESSTKYSGNKKSRKAENDETETSDQNTMLEEQVWEPSVLEKELSALEKVYANLTVPLDDPQRAELWREMAVINAKLGNRNDTTVCWANSLWDNSEPINADAEQWLACEQLNQDKKNLPITIDKILANKIAGVQTVNLLAAMLFQAAVSNNVPTMMTEKLQAITKFLQDHESIMSTRAAWLAWTSVHQISGGDVLALARARDRVLERLYQSGMRPEHDLPMFLRTGAGEQGDRFRRVFDQVLELREKVGYWVDDPQYNTGARTTAYAELIFSYGFARMGEVSLSREILANVKKELLRDDPIHRWVFDAYEDRIEQAFIGEATTVRLDEELILAFDPVPGETEDLKKQRLDNRYKVDRLRSKSRILEPHERVNAFHRRYENFGDALGRQLSLWFEMHDRDELRKAIISKLDEVQTANDISQISRVLSTAVELATRLGASFASDLLPRIVPVLERSQDDVDLAVLLERGIRVAGHFDNVDFVQLFVNEFENRLKAIVSQFTTTSTKFSPEKKAKLEIIESLFSQSFRGLRKLGMSDEINRLFSKIVEIVHSPKRKRDAKQQKTGQHRPLQLLLNVASGWFYFNQVTKAMPIVDEAVEMLFSGRLSELEQRELAGTYLNAVSYAPSDIALQRMQQLFEFDKADDPNRRKLEKINDTFSTGTHFSLSKVELVETLVLALVSDEFSLNAETRKYLDEDEFLIRRRIHHDVRLAMQHAGM